MCFFIDSSIILRGRAFSNLGSSFGPFCIDLLAFNLRLVGVPSMLSWFYSGDMFLASNVSVILAGDPVEDCYWMVPGTCNKCGLWSWTGCCCSRNSCIKLCNLCLLLPIFTFCSLAASITRLFSLNLLSRMLISLLSWLGLWSGEGDGIADERQVWRIVSTAVVLHLIISSDMLSILLLQLKPTPPIWLVILLAYCSSLSVSTRAVFSWWSAITLEWIKLFELLLQWSCDSLLLKCMLLLK